MPGKPRWLRGARCYLGAPVGEAVDARPAGHTTPAAALAGLQRGRRLSTHRSGARFTGHTQRGGGNVVQLLLQSLASSSMPKKKERRKDRGDEGEGRTGKAEAAASFPRAQAGREEP